MAVGVSHVFYVCNLKQSPHCERAPLGGRVCGGKASREESRHSCRWPALCLAWESGNQLPGSVFLRPHLEQIFLYYFGCSEIKKVFLNNSSLHRGLTLPRRRGMRKWHLGNMGSLRARGGCLQPRLTATCTYHRQLRGWRPPLRSRVA